jgi:hypothetical protein
MTPDALEFSNRIGGFSVKAHQGGMVAEDIADGLMHAAIKTASVVLSRSDLCEWLRRLAAEIEDTEPVAHVGEFLQ